MVVGSDRPTLSLVELFLIRQTGRGYDWAFFRINGRKFLKFVKTDAHSNKVISWNYGRLMKLDVGSLKNRLYAQTWQDGYHRHPPPHHQIPGSSLNVLSKIRQNLLNGSLDQAVILDFQRRLGF